MPRRVTAAVRAATTAVVALSCAATASASARADAVVFPDSTAQNLSSYRYTSAFSRRAADGTYRLVVIDVDGTPPVDANVRSSRIPFDPDLGRTVHNHILVVYSRCTSTVPGRGCDLYGYDLETRTERRLAASEPHVSETAPSYFEGTLAFARNGSRGGLYIARHGRRPRRISRVVPTETDLSATHVIYGDDAIRLSRLDGSHVRVLDRTARGDSALSTAASPVIGRDRAYWIGGAGELAGQDDGDTPPAVQIRSIPLGAATTGPELADRSYAQTDLRSIAIGPLGVPQFYSGAAGISAIDPLLTFGA